MNRPQTNDKADAFIKIHQAELAYRQPMPSLSDWGKDVGQEHAKLSRGLLCPFGRFHLE